MLKNLEIKKIKEVFIMFYDVLMEKRAERLEKVAVTMKMLRKAYKARVKPHLVRSAKSERKFFRKLVDANPTGRLGDELRGLRAGSAALTLSKDGIKVTKQQAREHGERAVQGLSGANVKPRFKGQLDSDNVADMYERNFARLQRRMKGTPNRDTFILMGGDTSKLLSDGGPGLGIPIPKAKTKYGREAFNRTVGLHEAEEMKAFRRSPSRTMKGEAVGPTFMSHMGVQPMLNDVNIANTFKGRGARDLRAQVGAMRNPELATLKEVLKQDPRSVELIERLEAGGRINRHGRKYLDRQYAKIGLGR